MANWIEVADAVAFMKLSGTPDEALTAKLQGFVDSACSQIEGIKGHVGPETFTAEIADTTRANRVALVEYPLLSVSSVERLHGDTAGTVDTVTAYDPVHGTAGYVIRDAMLFVPKGGTYRVTYQAGLDPIPPDWIEATLELVAHHYRASQINEGSGGRPSGGEDDVLLLSRTTVTALPYRVRELLGVFGAAIRSRVFIR